MNAHKSIVHVMHYGNPHAGSIVPLMCALGRGLSQRGHRFALVSTVAPGATWVKDVRKSGIELHLVNDINDAARKVRELRPDIAHCHFDTQVETTLALALTPAKVVWHLHTPRPNYRQRRFLAYVKNLIKYRVIGLRVDWFLAVSRYIATELEYWGVPTNKLRVLYLAIDTKWFRPPTVEERAEARRVHGIGDDERAVLFFGRDRDHKGGDFLEKALARTAGLTVIAVSTDARTVDGLRASRNRIIAIPPFKDMRELYWASDRLIMPSRREGLGFTLLEGLRCGLPSLANRIPVFAEIGPELPGLVTVDANNPHEFACRLAETNQIRFPIQNSLMAERWGFDTFINSCEALYEEISHPRKVRTRATAAASRL